MLLAPGEDHALNVKLFIEQT